MRKILRIKTILLSSLVLIFFALGWFGSEKYYSHKYLLSRGIIIRSESEYKFINPILGCEVAPADSFFELEPLKKKILSSINDKIKNKNLINASVYLRTLNSGRFIDVNGDDKYAPASLLKVLMMMGYMGVAELDQKLYLKSILYDGGDIKNQVIDNTDASEDLKIGSSYTVEDLIKRMIAFSSNQAMYLLANNIDDNILKSLREVYSDINVPFPESQNESDLEIMSAKTYSLVFRVLYGATFLNRNSSEKALNLLSKTDFKDGLTAGVPSGVVVSHKFGARIVPYNIDSPNGKAKELHDCGIVYYPDHPYVLCVMTRGYDFNSLSLAIADFSRLVYEELDAFYKTDRFYKK